MRRSLICLLLILAGVWPARAMELELKDVKGKPLAFAQVQVLGRAGWSVTDANGTVTIRPDPTPPFELLVADASGVLARPVMVETIPASGPLRITVGAGIEEKVDVVGAVPDAVLPPAAARTVIGRGDIDSRNPQQLADVLITLPGTGRLEEGASVVPSVRGLARSRTLILLDDGRVTAERRAGPSATFLDPETLAEVEVVRGPGSVAYGSEAFGGVIRARTRLPVPGAPSMFRYTAIAGDNGDGRNAHLEWSGSLGGGGAMIGGSWRSYDPYESPEGEVFNSGSEGRGFRAGYQHQAGRGNLSVLWRTDHGRDIGKPAQDSNLTRAYYPEENSHRSTVGYQMPGVDSWSRFAWSLTWADYELVTVRDRYATPSTGRKVSQSDVDSKDLGLRFDTERSLGPARLATGFDASSRYGLHATNQFTDYDLAGDVSSIVEETAIDEARRIDTALFAQLSADRTRFGWSTGARVDRVTTRNRGGYFGDRTTGETVPTGFAAGTIHLAKSLDLTGQIARGFRETLLSDRYFRGVSGRGYVVGNPDLNPETANQYDLALRWDDGRWRAAGYLFRYEIDDFVERYQSGADFTFRNREQATLQGVELEASVLLSAGIELLAGLSSLTGTIEADQIVPTDAPMADVPPRSALLQVRQRIGDRWSWMLRAAAYREDDSPGETEKAIPGYAVFDGSVGVRLSHALELQLLARNLTDKAYFATPDEVAALAPGRGFELSVRGSF